jgi:hypothetical protein
VLRQDPGARAASHHDLSEKAFWLSVSVWLSRDIDLDFESARITLPSARPARLKYSRQAALQGRDQDQDQDQV